MDIHRKSVDMAIGMDMDVKFHIHGKPDKQAHEAMYHVCGLCNIWLRLQKTEMSAALWAHMALRHTIQTITENVN